MGTDRDDRSLTERFSPSEIRRAFQEAPVESKRRVGIAAGGGAGLLAVVSLLGNGWQAHLADQADARHGIAESQRHERETRIEAAAEERCDGRAARGWTTYREHMKRAHGF